MATIFDIAKRAGVSITTVSRALNGYSDVNQQTRQRVIEAANELNYYPSAAARNLQGKKTNTIAFAPQLQHEAEPDPFLKEFIGTLALGCLKHDLSLLVNLTRPGRPVVETYRELAGTGRVDGVILADVAPQDERIPVLLELGLPFIAFGRSAEFMDLSYPFVDVDGARGIFETVAYLNRQGHRRIAFLNDDPFMSSCTLYRYQGYCDALNRLSLPFDERLVSSRVETLDSLAHINAMIARMFQLPAEEQPTAIITSHDRLAMQTLNTLKELGLESGRNPGRQIAVTGFDDLPFSAYLQPSLTTLRQPMAMICTVLLDVLSAVLNNRDEFPTGHFPASLEWVGPKQILIQPELVLRQSA